MKAAEAAPHLRESPASPARRKTPPTALVFAAFTAVYVIWGSTYLAIHIAIASIPPLLMSGTRFLLAGAILYSLMRLRGAPRPCATHWRDAAIVGGLLLFVGNGAVSWAEQRVPTNMTALIIAGTPLWMILLDWLRPGGSRPRLAVFAGLALGLFGVSLIVGGRGSSGDRAVDPLGAGMLVIASVSWACGSIYSRQARQPGSALLAVAMQNLAGGALLCCAGMICGERHALRPERITPASLGAFFYLVGLGSLVGFTAYVWLLGVSTPAKVSTYAYVNPLIAVFLGWLVLGEVLPRGVLLAAALTIGAVVLITTTHTSVTPPDDHGRG